MDIFSPTIYRGIFLGGQPYKVVAAPGSGDRAPFYNPQDALDAGKQGANIFLLNGEHGPLTYGSNYQQVRGQSWDAIIHGQNGIAVQCITALVGCVLADVQVKNNSGVGNNETIWLNNATLEQFIIDHVWVSESDAQGIYLQQSARTVVSRCIVENCDANGYIIGSGEQWNKIIACEAFVSIALASFSINGPSIILGNRAATISGANGYHFQSGADNAICADNYGTGAGTSTGILIDAGCNNMTVDGNRITGYSSKIVDNGGTSTIGSNDTT